MLNLKKFIALVVSGRHPNRKPKLSMIRQSVKLLQQKLAENY